jgi:hypothetical protein
MDIFDFAFLVLAVAFNLLIVGVLIATKRERLEFRRALGAAFVSMEIPFTLIFAHFLLEGRDLRTMISFGFVLLYIAAEFILDYVLKVEFRHKPITHIPYIVLEYIALFSLIGIAFSIDRVGGSIVSVTFWAVIGSLIYLYWDTIKQSARTLR